MANTDGLPATSETFAYNWCTPDVTPVRLIAEGAAVLLLVAAKFCGCSFTLVTLST